MVFGVDFGAKKSGKTVVSYDVELYIHFKQSETGKDADKFLWSQIGDMNPSCVAIDAPLSLPKAYFGEGHDYMYRHADRQLAGMSPMFLGGLTARAVAIKNKAAENGIDVIEAYPAAFLKKRFPQLLPSYKQDLDRCIDVVLQEFPVNFQQYPTNWHQFDAWICWTIGSLYEKKLARSAGDPVEGLIYF